MGPQKPIAAWSLRNYFFWSLGWRCGSAIRRSKSAGSRIAALVRLADQLRAQLPFKLTTAQEHVLAEIIGQYACGCTR